MTQQTPVQDVARSADTLTRREALRRASAVLGGAVLLGQGAWLTGCSAPTTAEGGVGLFSPEEVALFDEIAETILPATRTPGAKAASVGRFIALMVTDTYAPAEQGVFRDGITTLQQESVAQHGREFMTATAAQRHAMLERFDREHLGPDAPATLRSPSWFQMFKQLTVLGYFTSEIGCTQAQRYVETPGRYDPCVPLEPGDRSWAPHA